MEKQFIVTNHEYMNTGGNCMVSIFAVYDTEANVSRWVIANDEGFSYQTADTISNCDFQMDCQEILDKVMIYCHNWYVLVAEPSYDQPQFTFDEYELFKYCQFEHYKKDCKYFNNKVRLSTNELPTELFNKLTPAYIAWANLEGVGCLTDGYDVFMDDGYDPDVYAIQEKKNSELKAVQDFKQWLNDYVLHNERASNDVSYITIAVSGDSIKIPMHADSFEWLNRFLAEAIEKW